MIHLLFIINLKYNLHIAAIKRRPERGELEMTSVQTFPTLTIEANGSSGISIRAKLTQKYNCVEFTLRDDVPQDVFISPWMQFEPVEMADERLKLAYEIARRATVHEALMAEAATLQKLQQQSLDISYRMQRRFDVAVEMWRTERVKLGLPQDFSDIKEWPPEMMAEYC